MSTIGLCRVKFEIERGKDFSCGCTPHNQSEEMNVRSVLAAPKNFTSLPAEGFISNVRPFIAGSAAAYPCFEKEFIEHDHLLPAWVLLAGIEMILSRLCRVVQTKNPRPERATEHSAVVTRHNPVVDIRNVMSSST